MDGTEVRRQILAEHSELRRMLDEIDALVKRFDAGAAEAGDELRELGPVLYARFAAHLDSEDCSLVPALRRAGPDGEARAEQLVREHGEQRELLRFLVGRLEEQRPTLLIVRELRTFTDYIREDMTEEDKVLLVEELLGEGRAPGRG